MKFQNIFTLLFILPFLSFAQSFTMDSQVEMYLQKNFNQLGLSQNDYSDYAIYREYQSTQTGLTHVFLQQNYLGLPIHNAEIRLHYRVDKGWLITQNTFVKNVEDFQIFNQTSYSRIQAIESACRLLDIPFTKPKRISKKNEFTSLYEAEFSLSPIPVKSAYFLTNHTLRKVWDLTIYENDASNYWNVLVDAVTGEILKKYNWVQHCTFNAEVACAHETHETIEAVEEQIALPASGPSYNVFAIPLESPSHGNRSLQVAPNNPEASPYGWHDTNAIDGAEYIYTRGNNVHAYPDLTDSNPYQLDEPFGDEPIADDNFVFDFPFDAMTEPDQNLDAATVNLFYMSNMMHDVWYHYGFDPAAGNFQFNNYGASGYGGDDVLAESQDSSGVNANYALNNANFATPPDGSNPRMQMYIWDKPENPFDLFTVNSPEILAGVYEVTPTTDWAGEITSIPLTADIVTVDDGTVYGYEGCNNLTNDLTGKIALVSRGTCEFGLKALNAQNAGAVAVIIYNNVGGLIGMAAGAVGSDVTIPAVFLSKVDGDSFANLLAGDGVMNATFVNNSPPGPSYIDGDFDNGIIAHEYGHGISTRLTGTNCLSGDEQAGEGWSDFFGLAMTAKEGDFGEMSRGIGTYVSAENNEGRGIRSYPYSRDMSLNPMTYDDIITESIPHGVGSVWATMIWDLYWNFVDVYGYDPDRYNGSGGNNMVMQLVIDGLKLQPCNANFLEMRDAILIADDLLYNGENSCMIWETFARRGLGYSAYAGSSSDRSDGIEAFDNLPECIKELKIVKSAKADAKSTEDLVYTLKITNHTTDTILGVFVVDTLQTNVSYIAESSTCDVQTEGNVLTFTLGTMADGSSIECTYAVSPSEELFSEILFEDDMEDDDYFWVTWADEGSDPEWALIDFEAYSGEFAWYAPNIAERSVSYLGLEPFIVEGNAPTLSFWHSYSTEASYDGGYISISTDEVNFVEVSSSILRGHYRGVSQASPPLGGIDSFWGDSDGFINTLVDLSDYIGETVLIRFTYVTDEANADETVEGWTIDDVRIIDRYQVENTACVYSADLLHSACDNVADGGTMIYDRFGVSLNEISPKLEISLFPNPSNEMVSIRLSQEWENTTNLKVFDVQGKLIFEQLNSTHTIELSTQSYAAGLYFIELSDKTSKVLEKLTVQH